MSWNGFPKYIRETLIKRLQHKRISNPPQPADDSNFIKLWIRLPYCGPKGEKLAKDLIRKLRKFLRPNVKIHLLYNTTKVSFYCSNKDKIPDNLKSNVIYKITCPGCGENYVEKPTDV